MNREVYRRTGIPFLPQPEEYNDNRHRPPQQHFSHLPPFPLGNPHQGLHHQHQMPSGAGPRGGHRGPYWPRGARQAGREGGRPGRGGWGVQRYDSRPHGGAGRLGGDVRRGMRSPGRVPDDRRPLEYETRGRGDPGRPQRRVEDQPTPRTSGGRPWTVYRRSSGGATAAVGDGSDEAGEDDGGRVKSPLTLVSYNVLADSLVSFDYIPYCRTWNEAAWKARPNRTLKKILEFEPDVVCLQEVDNDHYEDFYKKSLESLGYVGAYCQRSGGKADGCATFVRSERVRLVEQEHVSYKIPGHPVLDRDNIALLVAVDVLSPKSSEARGEPADGENPSAERSAERNPEEATAGKRRKGKHSDSLSGGKPDAAVQEMEVVVAPVAGAALTPVAPPTASPLREGDSRRKPCPSAAVGAARVVIANTHLLFNPKRGDIKTAQLMVLTESVEKLAKKSSADGVIVCGDFNMTPDSALYHYMVKGALHVDGLNRFSASGQCGLVRSSSYDQRSETSNCGVMLNRVAGVKHQGGGVSLGSFLRPSTPTGGGRGGRGMQPSQPCETCSSRHPYVASSAYVKTDDAAPASSETDGIGPKNTAPFGDSYAVMDPAPCPCTADTSGENSSSGGGGDGGSGKGKKGAGNGGGAGGGRETHDPPLLWPSTGGPRAFVRGRGPVVHRLELRSAYAQQADAWGTGEPAFTSYHHAFKGTVDYVFYGPGPSREASEDPTEVSMKKALLSRGGNTDCLRCVGVVEPPLRCDLDRFGGLPSPEEPSDHILLAVRFEVTPR